MTLEIKLKQAAAEQDLLPATVSTYGHWGREFYRFCRLPVSQWTGEAVTRWVWHLHDLQYSASSRKQALNAVAFIFKHVMGALKLPPLPIERKTLRIIPSREELGRIFAGLNGQVKLMAALMYGSGLRVNECCKLRVKDIDFAALTVRVYFGARHHLPPGIHRAGGTVAGFRAGAAGGMMKTTQERELNDRRYRNRVCALRRYHRLADQFTRRGLTSRGQPRRRAANRTAAQRRELERARSLARWRARAAANTAAGLTTRGTRRKLRRRSLLHGSGVRHQGSFSEKQMTLKRYRQWRAVCRREFAGKSFGYRLASYRNMAWHLAGCLVQWVLTGRFFSTREVQIARTKTCFPCPLYDRKLKRCRPFDEAQLGCGCYTRFLVATSVDPCYGRKHGELMEFGIEGWV